MNELHYRYWIGILLFLIICTLTVNWAGIENLAELLSFGLALSSLSLAVIAIFQAFFFSNSFANVSASMTRSAEEVRVSAGEIKTASTALLERATEIPGAITQLSARFATLEDQLLKPTSVQPHEPKSTTEAFLSRTSNGGLVALYVCIQSLKTQKGFHPREIFKEVSGKNYVQGFIFALQCIGAIEARSERKEYRIVGLGELDKERILREVEESEVEFIAKQKKIVDEYFSAETQ